MTAKEAKELALSSQASAELKQHIEAQIKIAALLGHVDAVACDIDNENVVYILEHFRGLGFNADSIRRSDDVRLRHGERQHDVDLTPDVA